MADRAFELFDEYAAAYARGERPAAEDYLARAGDAAEELARLLDRFLATAPASEPGAEAVRELEEWLRAEPPLVELRSRRGLRVDDVVEQLVVRLGLDPAKRAKVKRYYQRFEGGLLDPTGVSTRVWAVVEELLGGEAVRHARWRAPATAAPIYLRALEAPADLDVIPSAPPEEPDEIDALFTSGR